MGLDSDEWPRNMSDAKEAELSYCISVVKVP
jgi:hypothetical protein